MPKNFIGKVNFLPRRTKLERNIGKTSLKSNNKILSPIAKTILIEIPNKILFFKLQSATKNQDRSL